MNRLKNAYNFCASSLLWGFFVFFASIFCQQNEQPTRAEMILQKQTKYLKNGSMESIIFYSQHEPESNKRLARNGILVKRPNAQATLLICHGFMCDKVDSGFLRTFFPNYNVMTFDFRAHGEKIDTDQCCTFGKFEAYDVQAAVNYIKSREDLQKLPLFVYGFSMGAVAAIQAQAQDSSLFQAMVLDCPYDHSENVIKRGLENIKFNIFGYSFSMPGRGLLEKYAFHPYVQSMLKAVLKTVANMDATATNTYIYPVSPAESIKKIKVPCFFIHCKNDEKVSIDAAQNVYMGAASFKRLWLTNGRRHFDSFFYNPEKYAYKINTFLNSVLTGSWTEKMQQKIIEDLSI